jgi:mRNA-degrading endonuclease RelE of RelBE toxin-antitoxin system
MNIAIQLFIHDSFFDSFSVLPRQIQKKTREFLKKFKENPKSPAINYEKINTFKDQSLRTVRIDGKYRAIVQAPENGDGYHLLWVDNHDEAMDWAKNKTFAWNKETQGFQLFEQPEEPVAIIPKSEKSKMLFEFLSDDNLISIGTPQQSIDLVRTFKTIEELNSHKNNLPSDVYEYLFYLAEGISLEEILEDISAGKEDKNPMQSSNALKHAFIVTDDSQLEEILNGSFEKWKIFLHPSQRALAYRDYNGPVKVTGGAGTGKTVCALHRAKYLIDKAGVFDQPILFTTYTKSLTQYLEETIKSLGISNDQVVINNIDKLIFDLANNPEYKIFKTKVGYFTPEQEKEIWIKAIEKHASPFDVDFFYLEYNEIILPQNITSLDAYLTASRVGRNTRIGRCDKLEIWKIIGDFQKQKEGNYSKLELCNLLSAFFSKQKVKPYSYLICDEIQDFSTPELSLLRSLVEERENDMFLVGDPFQNIYKKSLNFAKSGIIVKGRRSRKLKINYRTTEEIKGLAMKVVSNLSVDDFDGNEENLKGYLSLMHGNKPSYDIFLTPEAEDKFVLEKLTSFIAEGLIQPNEICVCSRTNSGLDDIKRLLNKANIKYLDLSSSKKNVTSVNVSTFHNMKGHEFKIVIAKGMSDSTVPFKHVNYQNWSDKEKASYDQQERSLYYVVFSRAIQQVIITGVGEKSSWIKE